jgi:hypothetical protein
MESDSFAVTRKYPWLAAGRAATYWPTDGDEEGLNTRTLRGARVNTVETVRQRTFLFATALFGIRPCL